MYQAIGELPNIGAIKIPGMPFETEEGVARLNHLRSLLPASVAVGVSGDKFGFAGMAAGCDLWLSVLGGLFPNTVKQLIKLASDSTNDAQFPQALEPLWSLFATNMGGLRVMATAADVLGICERDCLPAPLQPLNQSDRETLEHIINTLSLS